ncbi:MAG: type II secretion system F family protein [Candidatus Pacearchaeota archaeon]|nr:type II secretion system F family protein [Candidatus Pacearchaeota archaeon]
MTLKNKTLFPEFKGIISRQIQILKEINFLFEKLENIENKEEKKIINKQIESLEDIFKKTNEQIPNTINKINLPTPLTKEISTKEIKQAIIPEMNKEELEQISTPEPVKLEFTPLEKETLRRLRKSGRKVVKEKQKTASNYVKISNKFFSKIADKILTQKSLKSFSSSLIKANMHFLPKNYLSVVLFTTLLSLLVASGLFIFFLFFNISPQLPIITSSNEDISTRFMKVFWMIFVIPITTFIFAYLYPSLEAKSAGNRIDQELPFAAIHMASISGSLVDPSKIFSIILTTKEYPHIEKEFIKLLNQINLLGYDLVTALRNSAINSPSRKLSEMFNGIATTINSGGNLEEFFSKRAEGLLFEYRIEREKRTRSAETFMDIYISVVIAAPMILMLLLMMMKVSGLGLQLSAGMITLIMVLGITVVNAAFLTFLHLKQSAGGEE